MLVDIQAATPDAFEWQLAGRVDECVVRGSVELEPCVDLVVVLRIVGADIRATLVVVREYQEGKRSMVELAQTRQGHAVSTWCALTGQVRRKLTTLQNARAISDAAFRIVAYKSSAEDLLESVLAAMTGDSDAK